MILDPAAAALLDEQTGDLTRWFNKPRQGNGKTGAELFGNHAGNGAAPDLDSGGASRFFYVAKSASAERNRGLEHREAARFEVADHGMTLERWPDGSLQERKTPRQTTRNTHPTVKPVELMQWLCRLVTPPNGVVLDPFTGSGSTGIAALREGFSFIGIEREHEYVAIARDRIIGDAPLFNIAAEVVA